MVHEEMAQLMGHDPAQAAGIPDFIPIDNTEDGIGEGYRVCHAHQRRQVPGDPAGILHGLGKGQKGNAGDGGHIEGVHRQPADLIIMNDGAGKPGRQFNPRGYGHGCASFQPEIIF